MIYGDERDVVYFTDAVEIRMSAKKEDYSDAIPYVWVGVKSEDNGMFVKVHSLELNVVRTFCGVPYDQYDNANSKWHKAKSKSSLVDEADEYLRSHSGVDEEFHAKWREFGKGTSFKDMPRIREAYKRGYLIRPKAYYEPHIEYDGSSYRVKIRSLDDRELSSSSKRALAGRCLRANYTSDSYDEVYDTACALIDDIQYQASIQRHVDMEEDKAWVLSRMSEADRQNAEPLLRTLTWPYGEHIRWYDNRLMLGSHEHGWHTIYTGLSERGEQNE